MDKYANLTLPNFTATCSKKTTVVNYVSTGIYVYCDNYKEKKRPKSPVSPLRGASVSVFIKGL